MQFPGVSRVLLPVLCVFGTISFPAQAQKGTVSAPTAPSANTPQPTLTVNTPSVQSAPIIIAGRVETDDGSPVDPTTRIERVCGATVRLEAHVDAGGRFGFQLGSAAARETDSSTLYNGIGVNGQAGTATGDNVSEGVPIPAGSTDSLLGCQLRASLPGFHSDSINLSGHQALDNPDMGVIVLHHIGKIEGRTTSETTLAAPKPAKKLYDKGLQLAQKGDVDGAVAELTKATNTDPQFAIAWESLGELHSKQGQLDRARSDFEAAMKADSHYVNPYEQLAFLFARQGKWQQAADTSGRAVKLDPVEFPGAFWCNAVANFNLKHQLEAEKSVMALLKLDTQHFYPQAEKMMGQLLIDRGKTPEAVEHMRAYLILAPQASDAPEVRHWLNKVDEAAAQSARVITQP